MDLLRDEDFIKLEKEYAFLRRARTHFESRCGDLEKLSCVIVDLETTGLAPESNEIIEIGALKVEGKEIKDVFNKLVKPEKQLSSEITDLTGITQEMLASEPPIKSVIPQFKTFLGDSLIVAHNADFDVSFLKNSFKKHLSEDILNTVACTLHISRDLLPNLDNHKLHTVARYYGIPVSNRHRAIGDVEITYQVWLKFIDKLKERNIITRTDLESYLSVLNKPFAAAVSS